VFWGFFNAVPLTVSGGGDVEGAVLMFVDITDRKRAEEERRSLEARVQHAQKLESLGILAGGIAHDFNNLLTGILGNVSLALDGLAEDAPLLGNLRRVERAAERAAELTNQMLAYAGKASFVVGPLSLNAVVRDLVPLLGSSVSKKAQLDYELDPTLPDIEGDRSQIEQVVMNLITNASDALDSGEGRIRIRTGSTESELGGARRGDGGEWVFLEIADTGSGMDEPTRQRIFEPFFTTKFTGRGLGLAAVQGIVRGHGGRIRVESRVGDGTRFVVLLPVAASLARSVDLATDAEPRAVGAGTVLVIDDEEAVREVAATALELAGYDVLSASDGLEGVALFEAHCETIVAVLLDASMPRMGGEDALARIRAFAGQVPVLVISGHSERDAVARFEGAGIEGFLQKPFRAEQLVAKVHRLAAARGSRAPGNSLRSQA
jgi:signal transduction histidine kinase/ActR/RegA family two-component response regulator